MDTILLDALQEQFNRERGNREAYRLFSVNLDSVNWPGFSKWMLNASNEEAEHADKFSTHIIDRNEVPRFDALEAPRVVSGADPLSYFNAALQLEKVNTEAINELYEQAEELEDPQLCVFLNWAVEEQTKSERELMDIILMLQRLDNNGRVVMDAQMGG